MAGEAQTTNPAEGGGPRNSAVRVRVPCLFIESAATNAVRTRGHKCACNRQPRPAGRQSKLERGPRTYVGNETPRAPDQAQWGPDDLLGWRDPQGPRASSTGGGEFIKLNHQPRRAAKSHLTAPKRPTRGPPPAWHPSPLEEALVGRAGTTQWGGRANSTLPQTIPYYDSYYNSYVLTMT